ncbi:MAG: hypothetical protein NTW25_03800 [Candidatus Kapabacteria bacterium]|nr:hypothetical protein [Candidatus Kapabacteria bacterium]
MIKKILPNGNIVEKINHLEQTIEENVNDMIAGFFSSESLNQEEITKIYTEAYKSIKIRDFDESRKDEIEFVKYLYIAKSALDNNVDLHLVKKIIQIALKKTAIYEDYVMLSNFVLIHLKFKRWAKKIYKLGLPLLIYNDKSFENIIIFASRKTISKKYIEIQENEIEQVICFISINGEDENSNSQNYCECFKKNVKDSWFGNDILVTCCKDKGRESRCAWLDFYTVKIQRERQIKVEIIFKNYIYESGFDNNIDKYNSVPDGYYPNDQTISDLKAKYLEDEPYVRIERFSLEQKRRFNEQPQFLRNLLDKGLV